MAANRGEGTTDRVRRLAELVQTLSLESHRLAQVFADGQDLHATDMEALVHVMRAQRGGTPLTPGQLAERLGLSPSATTSVIDRLERQQHVLRERDLADRRRVHLLMDDAAADLAGAFFSPLARRTAGALEPFSAAELDVAARVMAALVASIRTYREHLEQPPATGP